MVRVMGIRIARAGRTEITYSVARVMITEKVTFDQILKEDKGDYRNTYTYSPL